MTHPATPSPATTPVPGTEVPTREQLAQRAAGFRWPPRGDRDGLEPRPLPVAAPDLEATPQAPRRERGWSIVEHVWLDLVAPPLAQRMANLGWEPDPRGVYCHRCALTVGPYEAIADGCPACRQKRLPWERIVRLGEYAPPLSQFIQEVKFTRWRRLGREMGHLLARSVEAELTAAGLVPRECIVVPVPTSFWRRMARGIDHTWVLGSALAAGLGCRCIRGLRRRHRPSQLDVVPSERAANVARSITPRRRVLAHRGLAGGVGERGVILVVDDVTTSGSTLRAACRAVGEALRDLDAAERPAIWAAVLARTPPGGEWARRKGRPPPDGASSPTGLGAAWT